MDGRTTSSDQTRRLEDFAGLFASDFRRRDQSRWLAVYLQGLVYGRQRKNVETLARQVQLRPGSQVEDPAQALQNFVNQSPWDENRLWRRFRALMHQEFGGAKGAVVVEDLAFPKQGEHSVGVQRQYWQRLGRKINCQLAVSLFHVGTKASYPLGLRLYLPRNWLRAPQRLDQAGVPEQVRSPTSKVQIALNLLDEVMGQGLPVPLVVAPAAYGASAEFRAGLAARGLGYLVEVPSDLLVHEETDGASPAAQPVGELAARDRSAAAAGGSLWTRVRCPDAAGDERPGAALDLLTRPLESGKAVHILASLPADLTHAQAERRWHSRAAVEHAFVVLRDQLGLDHFEGRSWRGFHHHACLVTLAYGFLQLEGLR